MFTCDAHTSGSGTPTTLALLAGLPAACSTPTASAPCLPEQVPAVGFDVKEAYVETSSVQCETRTCLVFRLEGDPRVGCDRTQGHGDHDGDAKCADATDTEDRAYCTCRCDADDTGFAECECPDGFSCVDVLEQGGPGVRGGYCVKHGTF